MPLIRCPNLSSRLESLALDQNGLAAMAKMSPPEIARLGQGETVRVKADTVSRLAKALAMRQQELVTKGDEGAEGEDGGAAGDDFDQRASGADRDVVYDDSEPVYAPAARAPSSAPSYRAPEGDADPTQPFERALDRAFAAGGERYTFDDRELVVQVLSLAELTGDRTRTELEDLARVWLDAAAQLREEGVVGPQELLERVEATGHRLSQRMVRSVRIKIAQEAARKAPKPGKGPKAA